MNGTALFPLTLRNVFLVNTLLWLLKDSMLLHQPKDCEHVNKNNILDRDEPLFHIFARFAQWGFSFPCQQCSWSVSVMDDLLTWNHRCFKVTG